MTAKNELHPAAWLAAAAELLNPELLPKLRVTAWELAAAASRLPPPPLPLQRAWDLRVWSLPGEPPLLRLSRCLCSHGAAAQLEHTLAPDGCQPPAGGAVEPALPWPGWAGGGIRFGLFRVVGVYASSLAVTHVQTGCEGQLCRRGCSVAPPGPPLVGLLPAHLGGGVCEYCGTTLELTATYAQRVQVVLQPVPSSASRSRFSAAVLGESVSEVVMGRLVRAIYYNADCGVTIHSAAQGPLLEPELLESEPSLGLGCGLPLDNPFHPAVYRRRQVELAQRLSFAQACELFAPGILSHEDAKAALLLCVLHTMYTRRRPGRATVALHAALLGPAKCGKSALSQALGRLCEGRAAYLTPAVVRGGTRRGSGLDAVWPSRSGSVLLGGEALLRDILVLDGVEAELSKAPAHASMTDLLRDGLVELVDAAQWIPAAGEGGCFDGCVRFRSRAQVTLAAHEESAAVSVVPLLPVLRLVIPLRCDLSVQQSARVGDSVVASLTRSAASSTSSSASRSPSLPSWRSLSQTSADSQGQSPQSSHLASACPTASTAQPLPPGAQLSYEMVDYWVGENAPEWPDIEAALEAAHTRDYFRSQLTAHAGLVLRAAGPGSVSSLPPPASRRGADSGGAVAAAGPSFATARARHLDTLMALAAARLLICGQEGGGGGREARPLAFTLTMAEEVWRVVQRSLQATARLTDASSRGPCPTRAVPPPPGAAFLSRRPAKRQRYLSFASALAAAQHQSRDEACSDGAAALLFEQMGGPPAFGDTAEGFLAEMQEMGLIIRRPGGWKTVGAA